MNDVLCALGVLLEAWRDAGTLSFAAQTLPMALAIELPLFALVVAGIVGHARARRAPRAPRTHWPRVSCLVTCHAEGEDVRRTMRSLAHQEYPGVIEIVPVVDGAVQNAHTLDAVRRCAAELAGLPNRRVLAVPRWQRGGRVSALNTGLQFAGGEIVMALDGDTSFDNDMVARATRHFENPSVVAVAGNLRVRNAMRSVVTRMQALEYLLSIGAGKTGLSTFNLVNNVSGAFGVFRAAFLRTVGGWDAGTAEDLDLTLRIKQYFGHHPGLRIVFEPHAIGHTDAPHTLRGLLAQRSRWEGDQYYLLVRKYRHNLRPRLLGWRNFLFVAFSGLFLQVVLPFVIVGYSLAMAWTQPAPQLLALAALVYGVYLAALAGLYALHLLTISERPREDLRLAPWLLLYPAFAFGARLHGAFATLEEIVLKGHLGTSMAPWWVLRRTRF